MSWEATAWAKKQITGSTSRKAVLLVIADYASHDGECWPSRELIAEDSEMSVDSVDRALKALEDEGFIFIERGTRRGPYQGTNLYRLNLDLEGVKKHMRGNRLGSRPEPQNAAQPEPQPGPQPGPQPEPQLCGTNLRTTESKNLTPLPPEGGTGRIFSPSPLEPDLERALQAVAAVPLTTRTVAAIEKALRPLGFDVFRLPNLPENNRGVSAGTIPASAVHPGTGLSIGFESDPTRGRCIDKLRLFPGRYRVIIREQGAEELPPEGIDAVLVRKVVPKAEAPPPAAGAQASAAPPGRVFVVEGTEDWDEWVKTTPILTVVRGEPQHQGFYPSQCTEPGHPHRGKRGRYFPSARPPSSVAGNGPLIEGRAVPSGRLL
jgi:Helix-turn-helix domain